MSDLCSKCIERQRSIERVENFFERHPDGAGCMICDPAPRAECKWHTTAGYLSNYEKSQCDDFIEKW